MTIAAAIVITATTTSVATTGRHLGECNRPFGKNKATSGTEKKYGANPQTASHVANVVAGNEPWKSSADVTA